MGIIRKNHTDQFREEAVKLSESVGIAQAGKKTLGSNPAKPADGEKSLNKPPLASKHLKTLPP